MEWNQLKEEFELNALEVEEWIHNEYAKIRSGRVSLDIFRDVRVMAYGELMLLNQLSNLQIVDARQVLIKPYDKSQINDIAKAISISGLNVNPQVNADNIRLIFSPQTEANRKENVKKAKAVLEDAKAKIRDVRKDVQSLFKKAESLSEDLIYYFEEELNKITKLYNNKLEDIFNKKESELMSF